MGPAVALSGAAEFFEWAQQRRQEMLPIFSNGPSVSLKGAAYFLERAQQRH